MLQITVCKCNIEFTDYGIGLRSEGKLWKHNLECSVLGIAERLCRMVNLYGGVERSGNNRGVSGR